MSLMLRHAYVRAFSLIRVRKLGALRGKGNGKTWGFVCCLAI